ncbi:glycosyl transferase family 4 [Candidatus Pacearchaeota archaeon]|nr:glycosyl transferase family 4 [Candidatus Pacearchaeota archaeon]
MEPLLILPLLVGFFLTLFFVPIWMKRAKNVNFVGKDIHKIQKKDVAEIGGISTLIGFVLGTLVYIAIKTFYFKSTENLIEIFSLLNVILMVSFIGLFDDLLGWKIGLNKKIRIFLLIFASIPLVVINAGESEMIGIEFGLLYPLFFIPLGIVGASATYNFLAGYNGLEASQGILILSALSLATWLSGNSWLSLVSLIMVFCLAAFYIYNKYPSEIFPGDILTYSVGAIIACIAILGNIEKIAVFFFIPYIIETILKTRGKLKKESFAKLNKDETLEMPYEKIYSLTHLSLFILKKIKPSKKIYEKEVVYLINFFQIIIIILGFVLFGNELI